MPGARGGIVTDTAGSERMLPRRPKKDMDLMGPVACKLCEASVTGAWVLRRSTPSRMPVSLFFANVGSVEGLMVRLDIELINEANHFIYIGAPVTLAVSISLANLIWNGQRTNSCA